MGGSTRTLVRGPYDYSRGPPDQMRSSAVVDPHVLVASNKIIFNARYLFHFLFTLIYFALPVTALLTDHVSFRVGDSYDRHLAFLSIALSAFIDSTAGQSQGLVIFQTNVSRQAVQRVAYRCLHVST